jgi:hypothetical protein
MQATCFTRNAQNFLLKCPFELSLHAAVCISCVGNQYCPREKIGNERTGVYSALSINNYLHEAVLVWKANSSSASPKILLILWNSKVHHRLYKSLTPFSLLSQMTPIHASPFQFRKINLNSIPLSRHRSSKRYFNFKCLNEKSVRTSVLPYAWHTPCPSHPAFDYRVNILTGYKSCLSASCSFLPLGFRCIRQHPIAKHLRPVSFPLCKRSSCTPV